MAFDYKREYREFYLPPAKPGLVTVPVMNYIAVRGQGDPNDEGGEYKAAMELLYGLAFTLKMSRKSGREIEGWFDYVVPPLEGFWWMEGLAGVDYGDKSKFNWISVIRLPDFIGLEDFDWARREAERKKGHNFSKAEFFTYDEGLCVQCLHTGPYDTEPADVAAMYDFALAQGYEPDLSDARMHHEIYLSDARRTAPDKLRTVIRHPIKEKK